MPLIEWRVIEKLPNGTRYRKFIDGKPTNSYKLELIGGDPSIDEQVSDGADDCEGDDGSSSFTATGTSLNLDWGDKRQSFRFPGVIIPSGATIDAGCYLSLYTWYTTGTVRTKVGADDQLAPIAPTDYAGISGITWTTAQIDWDDIPDADGFTNSPDIQSIIAELQASYDYSSGSAIQMVVKADTGGGGRTSIRTYENSAATAAKLHIEYTEVGGQDYPISTSCGLTASATVAYLVAYDRGMSPGLTAVAVIARKLAYDRATSPGLTVSATIAKAFGRLITTTADLTVSVTVAKLVAYKRAVSSGLAVSVSIVVSHFTGLIRTFYYYLKGSM